MAAMTLNEYPPLNTIKHKIRGYQKAGELVCGPFKIVLDSWWKLLI